MVFKKAKFEQASGVFPKGLRDEMNITIIFKATIPCGNNTILHITAQNDYQLFINGEFVFSGPARAGHGFYRVDHLPIEKHLSKGENDICVLVGSYRCNNFYLVNQPPFLCAEFSDGDKCFSYTGSDSWSAFRYDEKLQRVQRYSFQRPFAEVYDFSFSMPMSVEGKASLELDVFSVENLIEREVSYPAFPFEEPIKYIGAGNVSIGEIQKRFSPWWLEKVEAKYFGWLSSELEFSSSNLIDSLHFSPNNDTPSAKIGKDCYSTLEMRCNMTGLVCLELECESDTTLCLTFDELLSSGQIDYARLDCINAIIYKLKGKRSYKLITAEPYTFKYMNIISLGGAINIKRFGVIRMDFNESEIIKRLRVGTDEQMKRIYDAGVETFRQNTYDIYMDCASRERAGWLCDSFFTSRVEHLMSGKSTVEHSFLANFVMNEQYPFVPKGMLPMCYPSDHTDGNFIPNWAMWYVIELSEYFKRTNDVSFVHSVKDRVYSLLDYFRKFENNDGLLAHLEAWVFVEWSECNNLCQDINYPTNMLYYMLKRTIGELYDDKVLFDEASTLKDAIWKNSRRGLFFYDNSVKNAEGVYELSGKCTETCQYYAFFTGVTDRDKDSELWSTLVEDFGPERKQNGKWSEIYFSNAFIGNYLRCDLLRQAGLKEKLEENIRGYFDYMASETGTLWEYDSSCASCNHGFASHVLIWLDFLGYIEDK